VGAILLLGAKLLRVGVLGGVVVALAVFPVIMLAGVTAKHSSLAFVGMPADLTETEAGQASYVYAADGTTLLTTFYEEYRREMKLAEIPPRLHQAVVAAEDSRFYEHNGVDLKGLARAFVANQHAGGVEQGASTLTMQYVRMAMRDGARTPDEVVAATERTPGRKLREARIAIELEKRLSKDDILERYLNVAYFGHQAFGVFAAAQIYFSKQPDELTLAEAALLGGMVKAPTDYDPAANDASAATRRRDWVLSQMAQQRYITEAEETAAKAEPLRLKVYNPPNDCTAAAQAVKNGGFFCDYLRNWWMRQPAFGADPQQRLDELRRGGHRIVTTIDPALQATAVAQVMAGQSPQSPFAHGLVAVEPGTGRVKAMAVNRTFSVGPSGGGRNTVNALLGGGELSGYQAGSTFKFFTMLAALEAGMPLSTAFDSPKQLVSAYPGKPGEPSTCGDRWCPVNASDAMTGVQTMWSGFGKSVNTYFVQLEQAVGADKAVRMAERLGLRWRSPIDKAQASSPQRAATWGSFTLGTADTTPLEMANAIATVAAEGVYCEPSPVISVERADGSPLQEFGKPVCHQAVPVGVARAATDAARCVTGLGAAGGECGTWSTASWVAGVVGRPVAGKSGTTDDTRSAWFVGYTPQLVAASFIADPDNPLHAVGPGNSPKPAASVAGFLRDGLAGQPVLNFTYP
jgi:membrane peptidoglycan carboxypeptidase